MAEWDGTTERRQTSSADIMRVVEHVDARLAEHREDSNRRHEEILSTLKLSVPDGDFEAHRKYHEILIRREEWRQARRDKIMEHLAEKGVVAFLLGMITLLWYGIQVAMNMGPKP